MLDFINILFFVWIRLGIGGLKIRDLRMDLISKINTSTFNTYRLKPRQTPNL